MIAIANQLVIARSADEFRQASERVFDLIRRRAKAYRKNPSLARGIHLTAAIEMHDLIRQMCDCSCRNCWMSGAAVLDATTKLERGGLPKVDHACSKIGVRV